VSKPKAHGGLAEFSDDRISIAELGVGIALVWLFVWLVLRVVQ
jgi:hypothetical protein